MPRSYPTRKLKHYRRCAWTLLLREPTFDRTHLNETQRALPKERVKLDDLLHSLGLYPPFRSAFYDDPSYCFYYKQAEQNQTRIRQRVSNCIPFAQSVFQYDTMGISPTDWPVSSYEAFNLENPPTPYEVAKFTLGAYPRATSLIGDARFDLSWVPKGGNRFWQRASGINPLYMSAFRWWLLGVSAEGIQAALPEVEFEEMMVEVIQGLMNLTRFALWALSPNLMPVIRDRKTASAFLLPWAGKEKVKRREVFKSTHVQTLLALGRCPNPIDRVYWGGPTLSPTFRNLAEKKLADDLSPPAVRSSGKHARRGMWWVLEGRQKYPNLQVRKKHLDEAERTVYYY